MMFTSHNILLISMLKNHYLCHSFCSFMEEARSLLSQEFLGNTLGQYATSLIILMLGLIFTRYFSRLANRLLFRLFSRYTEGIHIDRFHQLLQKPVHFALMLLVIFIALSNIHLSWAPELAALPGFSAKVFLYRIFQIVLYSSFIWIALRLADFFSLLMVHRAAQADNKYSSQVIPFLVDALKIVITIIGILTILSSVFGLNVATLVAGLGIGGLAVALAARETLENLMGSFTIFLDKPFVVGDMVKVGSFQGVVERVGFRSTRLRTLDKSYVTLPNKKMVDSELDNLSLRTFRRANFNIGLTYSTSPATILAVVNEIQQYIDNHPLTNQDGRVRFTGFGASSLDIMVMYLVDTTDWTTFLDVQQQINFQIMEIVKNNKAEFAFPSTSLYVEKTPPAFSTLLPAEGDAATIAQ